MPFRVTDASTKTRLLAQIATGQQRGIAAQERLASGKRINRPSDDPAGAGTVIRLRTTQAAIDQLHRNGQAATDALLTSDATVESFEQTLDRVRTLLLNGITEPNSTAVREALATEIDGIRDALLTTANMVTTGGQYIFGGTRQDVPPFDPVTAVPAATPTSQQLLRVELGAPPVTTGVTAEQLFSNTTGTIFATLTSAAAAPLDSTSPGFVALTKPLLRTSRRMATCKTNDYALSSIHVPLPGLKAKRLLYTDRIRLYLDR
jgi:flagellar hook-associated protein 3 FlgL